VFVILILGLVVAAAVHFALQHEKTVARFGELGLLWVMVGYCGLAMLAHAGESLLAPQAVAAMHGFPDGGIWQAFTTWALLGMAGSAAIAPWYRGTYLIGPAVSWAVYFAGATAVHIQDEAAAGPVSGAALLGIFLTHGLVAVLLLLFLVLSGVWRRAR
jgi:hypothetical protein